MHFGLRTLLALSVLFAFGCDCSGPTGEPCTSTDQCEAGESCVDGHCMAGVDGGDTLDANGATDAGRDGGGGSCPSMTLCGSPAQCCEVGEECVEGGCLAACESGVRCGASRDVCCGDGQVCVNAACTDPGDECTDSFDCPMGQFCEPTLGRCLPQFDPVMCEQTPVFGAFSATIEWDTTTSTTEAPTCIHGVSAPIVVDLTGDGRPEVVANFACEGNWRRGVLRAWRGDGTPYWTVTDADLETNGRTGIAGGDLDGDGRAEIVAVTSPLGSEPNRIVAFDDDGTVLWRSFDTDGTTPFRVDFNNGAPTIADLGGADGPEVILGAIVLNAAGVVQWTRDREGDEGSPTSYTGGIAAVADIDMDGEPEIVTGRRAYEANGNAVWPPPADVNDGYPAIAQFDGDPQPEIVLVGNGEVYLLDGMTGAVEWGPIDIPGGGIGGPPTVADFDGDGRPEIGVAGAESYSVYDPDDVDDGIIWSRDTQDASSNATGSSVFDFEGDGAAEVVYGDECYMRVYRGSDGMVLLQIDSLSATIHEYPLVADVDADGNSEIVIVANNNTIATGTRDDCVAADPEDDWSGERAGLFVYGDTRDQWVRTRRVWNQHAYHVTNIDSDGTVPMSEMDNWSVPGLNNYRQNAQGEGVFNAPDLAILALEVLLDGCPNTATLRARVVNEGSLGVAAGVSVSFYTGTPDTPGTLLGTATTSVPLLPGASTVVELADVALAGDAPYSFVAVVDDDGSAAGTVTECNEDNNRGGIGDLDCDILF